MVCGTFPLMATGSRPVTDARLRAIWPFVLLWILQIADILTTAYALTLPGNIEGNPLLDGLLSTPLGLCIGLTAKLAVVAFMFSIRHKGAEVFNAALLLSGIYAHVIYNNLQVISTP